MNEGQLDLLEEYIGERGNYTSTILEANQLDLPTKILYLNKAITEDSINFNKSLDELKKLLDEFIEVADNTNSHEKAITIFPPVEIITSLRVIHDLYFNNELNYTYGGVFPTTKQVLALDHYFKGTGEINPEEFRKTILSLLKKLIRHHESLYYSQFSKEFWKNSIRNEFILEQDNLNEVENNCFVNEENLILRAKFWQEIYKHIEKQFYKYIPAKYLNAIKAVVKGEDTYFEKNTFLYNYLYYRLENVEIEGIKCLSGDLIDFATYRNNQNLLDIMFQTISPLDKIPDGGYAACLQYMGNSLFHQAIALRQMSEIKELVCEHKIDVNSTTYSLHTPLALACRYGHLEVVEFLLANNADINQRYGMMEHYPLQAALENGHFVIAKLLIDKGAKIFFKGEHSFLFDYCLNKNIGAVKFLLEYTDARFNIDRVEPKWNESPIGIAYKYQHLELISLLNEHKKSDLSIEKSTQSKNNELAVSLNQLVKEESSSTLIEILRQNQSASFFSNLNSQNRTENIPKKNGEKDGLNKCHY